MEYEKSKIWERVEDIFGKYPKQIKGFGELEVYSVLEKWMDTFDKRVFLESLLENPDFHFELFKNSNNHGGN